MVLVRGAAAIPTAQPAQSTDEFDWTNLAIEVFADHGEVEALVRLPIDPRLHRSVV